MALDMNMGGLGAMMDEDTMEGALGGGTGITPPRDYQIPVNRQPAPGGLTQAAPGALASAKQDYLKATQDMITALEQRISGQGYDISRLLFAFGQPTGTGSIGSALANLGAEASRQRGEQEKNLPTMMKMRTELAANRLAMAQQEEAERIASMLGIGTPGANVQAAPGSGASAEAAVGNPQVRRLMSMDPEQLLAMTRPLGPAGEQLYRQVMQAREDYRKNFLPGGDGSFFRPDTGQRIYNPAELAKPIERQLNLGNANIDIKMPLGDWMKYDEIMDRSGQAEAAKFIVGKIPSLGPRIGAIAPPRPLDSTPIAPAQQPVMQPSQEAAVAQPSSEAAAPAQKPAAFETESEKKQRMELEAAQARADIEGISKEKFELRKPITLKYRDADKIMQIGREMESLASANPQILGILAKGGLGPALLTFFDSGVSGQAGSSRVQVNVGDLPKALSRVVDANPATVQQYAQSKGISISQAKRELQNEALSAQSLLLQKERQLDSLINKPDRAGEGSVATYERIMFAQALPTAREDPAKAYIFKVKQLQEQARFDKKVGELMDKFEAKGINDPRKMYKSQEYIDLRNNYVGRLDALYSTFFPSLKNRLAGAKKEAGF